MYWIFNGSIIFGLFVYDKLIMSKKNGVRNPPLPPQLVFHLWLNTKSFQDCSDTHNLQGRFGNFLLQWYSLVLWDCKTARGSSSTAVFLLLVLQSPVPVLETWTLAPGPASVCLPALHMYTSTRYCRHHVQLSNCKWARLVLVEVPGTWYIQ